MAKRSAYFDCVRGISAQMVLVGHTLNFLFPASFLLLRPDGHYDSAPGVFYPQNLGVVVFFALSGYLVTNSVLAGLRRGDYGISTFLLDRASRIFVPFIPALILIAICDHMFFSDRQFDSFVNPLHLDLITWVLNATMLFNHPVLIGASKFGGLTFIAATTYGTAAPFWTVVIEWWIYVTFGITVIVLLQRKPLNVVALGLVGFASAVPIFSLANSGLVLGWVVGMTLACASSRIEQLDRRALWPLCIALLVIGVLALARNHLDMYNSVVVIAISCLVVLGQSLWLNAGSNKLEPKSSRRLLLGNGFRRFSTLISDYSYSLYLIHFSILMYLRNLDVNLKSPSGAVATAFVICNVSAILFWYLFERHFSRVGKFLKFYYCQFTQPAAAQT